MTGQSVPPPGIPLTQPDGAPDLTWYRWWNFVQQQIGGLEGANIALVVPGWLTVTGSPITSLNGTFTVASANEPANTFLAAPSAGAGPLSPRKITTADLPASFIPPPTFSSLGGVFEFSPIASRWLTGVDATGTFQFSQPAMGNISDYVPPTSWSPVDASGAGLALTVNFSRYMQVGNELTAYASITYPGTANANAAMIGGLPTLSSNFVNAVYTGNGVITSTAPAFGVGLSLEMLGGATQFSIFTDTSGTATNANLSSRTIAFTMRYMI